MPVKWIDVTQLSFNTMLLLERVQLSWFPGWVPEPELAVALRANPAVEWYMRHKCPEINAWLDSVVMAPTTAGVAGRDEIRQAEVAVLNCINDLITYAVAPEVYDAQPFLGWDSSELTTLVDFSGKVVLDIGSGTGRLALVAAPAAQMVFAVEPVANLRGYLRDKALRMGFDNVYPVDGLVTSIPFPPGFADVTVGGHVFGDAPGAEYRELARVTKPGGMIILCPGNVDCDNDSHRFLVEQGFEWSTFAEPGDGLKRKYWGAAVSSQQSEPTRTDH